MKLIVWGTGNLYRKYKEILSQFELTKLCDNSLDKIGGFLDGVEIIAPSQLKKYDFDYIVVMTYATEEVCHQIESLEISADKVILYSQLWCLKEGDICVHCGNKTMGFDNWIIQNPNSILLISDNFSYTGVPVAIKNMANVLRRMGYSVLIAAMEGGTFERELLFEMIDYIDDLELGYQTEYFKNMLQQFIAIVVGTFDLYRIAETILCIKTPTIWWVHETYEMYYMGKEKVPQRVGLKFFAGGNRVKKIFTAHYRECDMQKLQYCIPDFNRKIFPRKKDVRMVVSVIGTVIERKAQDILLEALVRMPEDYRNKLKVIFVGKIDESDDIFVKRIMQQKSHMDNLEWILEMTQERLDEFYSHIDVLVCPSRDDPMPIVVTQAMMHEKICIVSENVGQAEFIEQQKNGFVFPNENAEILKEILIWLLENRDQCAAIGKASRKIYEEEFSEKVMEKNLNRILSELFFMRDT